MSRFSEILASLPESPSRRLINEAIQETMASQATVISRAQLEQLGVDGRTRGKRVKAFDLYPAGIARGIYRGHAGVLTPEGRRWAGLLWAPEPSWLTGASAASELALERPSDAVVHVITHFDAPRRTKAPGVRLQRAALLPPADLTRSETFPCTAVARAMLDLCADKPRPERLAKLVAQAEILRIYDHLSMHRVLKEHPRVEGVGLFQAALEKIDGDSDRARSVFEQKVVDLIRSSTELPPVAQNPILEGLESDIWFPQTRAVIEADGRKFHRTAAQILRDAEREAILIAAGFQILRVLWEQVVYEPEATLRRIVDFYRANIAPPDPTRLAGRLHVR